jgi:hypothetical protein
VTVARMHLKESCHVWNSLPSNIEKFISKPVEKSTGHDCRLTFHRRLSSARLARS